MSTVVSPIFSKSNTYFDLYPLGYFLAKDRPHLPIDKDGNTKELGDRVKDLPQPRMLHPAIEHGEKALEKPFVQDLTPLMDVYHDHFREIALEKEILARITRRYQVWDLSEARYFERIDEYQAYVIAMLFERVFINALARHHLFLDLQKEVLDKRADFIKTHRDKRVEEHYYWLDLFYKFMEHPYKFEIKRPNELKRRQKELIARLDLMDINRALMADASWQRKLFGRLIGRRWLEASEYLAKFLHEGRIEEAFQTIRDMKLMFEKHWEHKLMKSAEFRELFRKQMLIRSNYFPELFRQDQVNPVKSEPKLPNELSAGEKLVKHINDERLQHVIHDENIAALSQRRRDIRYTKHNYGEDANITKQGIIVDRQPLRNTYKTSDAWQDSIHIVNKVNHKSMAVATYMIEEAIENPNAFQTERIESSKDREQDLIHFEKGIEEKKIESILHQKDTLQAIVKQHHQLNALTAGLAYSKNPVYQPDNNRQPDFSSTSEELNDSIKIKATSKIKT